MAFFMTQVTDDVMLLLEAETTGAFSKSDLEIRPNPLMAFLNSVDAVAKLGKSFSDGLSPTMETAGCDIDVNFGVKVDGAGSVMISKEANTCQFNVTMRFTRGG
ncbi:MAG: hypothetical protein ACI8PZ_005494 [Myxococcota bacterium]|jgi:hypothetical protein